MGAHTQKNWQLQTYMYCILWCYQNSIFCIKENFKLNYIISISLEKSWGLQMFNQRLQMFNQSSEDISNCFYP